jgi:exportin-2 (importin alpha re-exporter)
MYRNQKLGYANASCDCDMSSVPALLAASLSPDKRKVAEAELASLSLQPGFLPHVLQVVLDQAQSLQVRQAACLYFKNQVKRRWDGVRSLLWTMFC